MSCDSEKDVPIPPKLLKFSTLLEDGLWHSISEIAEEIHVSVDKVKKACDILEEFGLIEREGEKVKGAIPLFCEC